MPHLRSIALGTLLVACVVTLAAAQEVRDTIGPIEKTARPATPENPIPRRIASAQPERPTEVARFNGTVSVWLWITLEISGSVAEIRNVGGPASSGTSGETVDVASQRAAEAAALVAAAAAVTQWKYEAPAAPIVFVVLVNFTPGREPTVSQQYVSTVMAGRGAAPRLPPPPVADPWPAAERAGAIRLTPGPGMRPPKPTRRATPRYSAEAMAAKVQGTVRVEILVGTDGKVKDARILQSVSPLLNQPAIDAARRWEFTPALVNGQPKPFVSMLELDFNLR